jgi:hypothetical protein
LERTEEPHQGLERTEEPHDLIYRWEPGGEARLCWVVQAETDI